MTGAGTSLEFPRVEVIAVRESPTPTVWWRSTIVLLVVLAFAVRIAFMLAAHTYRFTGIDDHSYLNETTSIARSIADGRGFSSPFSADYTGPTAWISPVYPYVCALAFMLFGVLTAKAAVALFVIQSVFSALTCIPILAIGERTMSRRAGIIAATLWALFPWFSKWAVTWVWEISLSALLFALLFWYALRLARPAPATRMLWIGFGALWGFALLVNPALLPLFPAALLWCGIELRKRALASNWSSWIKLAFLSLAACFLVISPWLVRNRVVFGQWVFLRGNFGFEFYLGNNAHSLARGWGGQHPTGNPAELGRYRTIGEVAYVRERTHDALQWVRQSPAQFALLTAERARYFWDGSAMAYRPAVSWYWCPWSFAAFSFLMLPALLIAHRRRLYGWPLFFSALLLYPIPYYLTFSQVRYRHVLEPLMLLLLVSALHRQLDLIWNRLFRRTREISHPHSQLVAN